MVQHDNVGLIQDLECPRKHQRLGDVAVLLQPVRQHPAQRVDLLLEGGPGRRLDHPGEQLQSLLVGQRALQDDVDADAHVVAATAMALWPLAAYRPRRATAACTSSGAASAATVVPGA